MFIAFIILVNCVNYIYLWNNTRGFDLILIHNVFLLHIE